MIGTFQFIFSIWLVAGWPDCSPDNDGHTSANQTLGVFTPISFLDVTWTDENNEKTQMYLIFPPKMTGPYPLVAFMHGSTGQYEMYKPNIEGYASQGFVVIFPFLKNPDADKSPLTLETTGEHLLRAIKYAEVSQSNSSAPLYGLVDMSRIATAGHSMGATCSIMAAHKRAAGSLKTVVTQHPGVCGPFGPPPWPSTWMPSDFQDVTGKFPTFFTTATNDGAFWPAPQTAVHEKGCWNKGVNGTSIFVQFSEDACNEDHIRDPFPDSGHNCPFKSGVETPWVTTWLKLYLQQDGSETSQCFKMVWGSDKTSLKNDPHIETSIIHP